MSGLRGEGGLVAVDLAVSGSDVSLGAPRPLFESGYAQPGPDFGGNYHTYAVSRDGQRFLIPRAPTSDKAPLARIKVIVNWASTLPQ